ncbi:MAG: hypothetical protein N3A55_07880 [Methylohalobius sp.]|nr:hypothetical protein [Methylohalobius sp.]
MKRHRKDEALFEALAAFNERFAKLQDVLGAAMRHAFLLHGENPENFLKVLAWYEKQGVVDSIETWQILRTIRNLAAHEYEIDYEKIAEHFNALHEALPVLYRIAARFLTHCQSQLRIGPASQDFGAEFEQAITEIAQD